LTDDITLLHPSRRTDALGFSDIVKIRNRVLAMKEAGQNVLQLEGGEPFAPTPDFVKNAMKKALDENQTRYAPSSGVAPLLSAIERKVNDRNQLPATREQIIVTAGGMHGLFCAFQAALNEGDEVIFFSPYWTPIRDLVAYAGGKQVLIPWEEIREGDMSAALQKRLTASTRVIYVNTPSNPTGDILTRAQLEAIANFAKRNNLVVISDEAYEDITYDQPHVSIGSLPDMFQRTISVYTLSKSFSMTGWRVGYIVAGERWMEALRKLVLNSVNGVSTPSQFAAAAAVADESGHLMKMRDEYRRRRDLLVDGVRAAGLSTVPPRGAFYLFADARERFGADSWKSMNALLERTGIATVPGIVFGPHGEGFLRMSYSNSIETLERAIAALERLG
jgi:aspartate/methionine/tyrosine aminotransferase